MYEIHEVPLLRRLVESGIEDLAALFEAAIEALDKREEQQAQVVPAVWDAIIGVLEYFENASSADLFDLRTWPLEGMKVTAAYMPLETAAKLFGVDAADLDRALLTREPFKPWSWWQTFGEELRSGATLTQIRDRMGIHYHTARKYAAILTSSTRRRDPRIAAWVALVQGGTYPADAAQIVGYHPTNARRLMASEKPLAHLGVEELRAMALKHVDVSVGRTEWHVLRAYGITP